MALQIRLIIFFEPLSTISVEEARKSKNVSFYNGHTCGEPLRIYGRRDDNEIEDFAKINSKYIHIRQEIYEQIECEIEAMLGGKKTLAVHVRGVEWGTMKYHPVPASLEEYVKKIDIEIEQHHYEQIFLATDSDDTIAYFKEKYGGMIVFYSDAARASSGSKVLPIFSKNSQRENDGFWLGYEVLRDMLTLSFCDGLVAGYSYISFAAQVFKRSRKESYVSRSFVDQQVYQKGKGVIKFVDNLLKKEKVDV